MTAAALNIIITFRKNNQVEKKILNTNILAITTVINRKTSEVELSLNFKNTLFGATSAVKEVKRKYVYSGKKIIFDSAGSWSFDNAIARNVILLIIVHHLMPTIATITF